MKALPAGRRADARGDERRHAGGRPRCPHAPSCVPCPLRGRPYGEQLARKHAAVVAALAQESSLRTVAIDEVVGSRDLFGYRTVAKLVVRGSPFGGLRAGVYEPGSHRLVAAEGCEVHHPAIQDVVEATLREASRLEIRPYDDRDRSGDLRYLVVRASARRRRAWLTLVTATAKPAWAPELARRIARRATSLAGVLLNVNDGPGNVILGKHFLTLRPPVELVERFGFLEIQASPSAFLQVNPWTARRIYETAAAWSELGEAEAAVDLYCGVGALTLHLAVRCARAIGVEAVASAADDARANARRNGIGNSRFVSGAVEEILPRLLAEGVRPAVITLNPPRKGAAPTVVEAIVAAEPRRILYVSCDPRSLARDLARFAAAGYRPTRVAPFDMMPQTEHVEVLAMLDRSGGGRR